MIYFERGEFPLFFKGGLTKESRISRRQGTKDRVNLVAEILPPKDGGLTRALLRVYYRGSVLLDCQNHPTIQPSKNIL